MSSTAGHSCKAPPQWDEDKLFEAWKQEVDLWNLVTDLAETKKGPAIALSLQGRKREIAMEMDITELNAEDGLEKLLQKLESVFARATTDQAFDAYEKFESLTRVSGSVPEFIQDFERAYTKVVKHGMKLPDSVLACKLLRSAGLDQKEKQLILATSDKLEFDAMKSSLKRIYSSSVSGHSSNSQGPALKQEPAFVTTEESRSEETVYWTGKGRFQGRNGSGSRNRSSQSRGNHAGARKTQGNTSVKGTNPTDSNGRISTCVVCGSRFHWVKDCPNADSGEPVSKKSCDDEKVFLTFAVSCNSLLKECHGLGILDTACTATVAGEAWLKSYIESLSEENKKQVTYEKTSSTIVFGDGNKQSALEKATFPAQIGNTQCRIVCEVIKGALPLLISVKSMRKARIVLDIKNNVLTLSDSEQPVPLKVCSTGHLAVPLIPPVEPVHAFINISQIDEKAIKKLHCQFGHCTASKLQDLLRNAGQTDKKLMDAIVKTVDECESCIKVGRPKPKPSVGLPMATRFNDVVAMDLHQLTIVGKNIHYLHLIDLFSRYSTAIIITGKKPETIINGVLESWCCIYGKPRKLLTDNGGEFDNHAFRSLGEIYDIDIATTSGESPWSNGICERHNCILTETFLKTRMDMDNNTLETDSLVLKYSAHAKNCLHSHNGYSPYQIVFGANPNLPSTFSNRAPALENVTTSISVAKHLFLLHKTRQAYLMAESSERVKRALRTNIRYDDGPFFQGDQVYYKRNDKKLLLQESLLQEIWRGPAKVIGQDGRVVIVRHGGYVSRVHPTRMRKCAKTIEEVLIEEKKLPSPAAVSQVSDQVAGEGTFCDEEETFHTRNDVTCCQNDQTSSLPEPHLDTEASEVMPSACDQPQGSDDALEQDPGSQSSVSINSGCPISSDTSRQDHASYAFPKNDSIIKFWAPDDHRCYEAKVVCRAGKATGKHKNWVNIEYRLPDYLAGSTAAIDLENGVSSWEPVTDCPNVLATGLDGFIDHFIEAKLEELEYWRHFQVFSEVERRNQQFVTLRWVCTFKDGNTKKARLVARGFQDPDANSVVKDSPTCSRESLRVLLSLFSSSQNWHTGCIDVKSAFLQGSKLTREVFVMPPEEAQNDQVLWKLEKGVYGLSDAPRLWFDRVVKEMEKTGCHQSKFDRCVFFATRAGDCIGVVALHVDDFGGLGRLNLKRGLLAI